MRIILTGGAGFIGSNISDLYIKEGHQVFVLDNLSTGFRSNLNPRAKFFKADIRNPKTLDELFKKIKPEVVNHHAALASVIESVRNPQKIYENNLIGTANLLVAFEKFGAPKKKFIFASTGGAIYGNPKIIPADEKTAEEPLSPYGLSKLLGEGLIKYYAKEGNFPYTIFRYANVFGPRQNPKGEAGVVSIFTGLMLKGKQPIIFGNGKKTRDYIFVGDVARANLFALTKGNGETINLGSGKEISDQEIFEAVARATNYSGKPQYASFRKGEVNRISISAKLAKKVLGWQPKLGFQEGVEITAEYIRNQNKV